MDRTSYHDQTRGWGREGKGGRGCPELGGVRGGWEKGVRDGRRGERGREREECGGREMIVEGESSVGGERQ